jgi:hypothetical protein
MSLEEERAAGIEPEYTDEELETSHGKIRVVKQVPESDEGSFDPQTKQVIRFHRQDNPEQLRKAA